MDIEKCDCEREDGFMTNFGIKPRKEFVFRLAGWLLGYKVWFQDNCTDINGHLLNDPKCRALYILPSGDMTKYWRFVSFFERVFCAS